ncbi:hypothetical protein ACVBEJ_14350 [Porticoccus sp. GXU_MW_L64]
MIEPSKVTGVLRYWTLHDLSWYYTPEMLAERFPGAIPMMLTGMSDYDVRGSWQEGCAMRSSLLRGFDLQNMAVYTLNSVYLLSGPGRVSTEWPEPYDEVVGKTILLIKGMISCDD